MTRHLAAILLVLLASAARAERWTVFDLGDLSDEETCKTVSHDAMTQFQRRSGGGRVAADRWVIYGFDMYGPHTDAVITCTAAGGRKARATLVVHSGRGAAKHMIASRQLVELWNQTAAEARRRAQERIQDYLDDNGF